tara:strand:- start:92 stop:664 length:573 start_codon:yes stop_codon:yes gene_type:complete
VKKIIQFILIIILISSIGIFYKKFFDQEDIQIQTNISDKIVTETENNTIKNLKYEVSIKQNNDYKISSEVSEIVYKNGMELVLMSKVEAILKDNEERILYINSDQATYNSYNFTTIFEDNVQINYLDNKISAEKMILNFEDNLISMMNNVKYIGPKGLIKTDNIKINLITKKIDIFMNKPNENVIISSIE